MNSNSIPLEEETNAYFIATWRNEGWSVFSTVLQPSLYGVKGPEFQVSGIFRYAPGSEERDTRYRFLLRVKVDPSLPGVLGVVAMNPSKALKVARQSDHTVSRLINFARMNIALGYGTILLGNCFATYETDSSMVRKDADDVTALNDCCLRYLFAASSDVVIATGGADILRARLQEILNLNEMQKPLICFRQKEWFGCHPSRGSYDSWVLTPFDSSNL